MTKTKINRRDFIKQSAVASTTVGVGSGLILGTSRRT
ncbi:MAG: twin-arginine translocation signal domain-containing protein [Acidobacteriota bacterium]